MAANEEELLYGRGIQLNDPINIHALTTNGARFSIDNDGDINREALEIADDDDSDEELDMVQLPAVPDFDEFRAAAEKVADHDIYKRVKKQGYGIEVLGTQNARVVYHFHAYLKGETHAFDSSSSRRCPDVLDNCRNAYVLPGVLYALQTMRAGEHAEFIVGYKLMYGKMGCPPRVPQQADIYFIIELVRFNETGDAAALENVNEVDRKKFPVVLIRANEVYKKAVDSFKNGRYAAANSEFDTAIKALEFCNLANEAEQDEQQSFLVKLYRNQAVCYNKRELWKKTCLMCQELLRIGKCSKYNAKEDCKAQFQWGRALLGLGDFKRARELLERAQALEPHNMNISSELLRLASQQQTKQANDAEFARRAMGILKISEDTKLDVVKEKGKGAECNGDSDDDASTKFQEIMRQTLLDFLDEPERAMTMPEGLTDIELVGVKELADELGLKFQCRNLQNKKTEYTIAKV